MQLSSTTLNIQEILDCSSVHTSTLKYFLIHSVISWSVEYFIETRENNWICTIFLVWFKFVFSTTPMLSVTSIHWLRNTHTIDTDCPHYTLFSLNLAKSNPLRGVNSGPLSAGPFSAGPVSSASSLDPLNSSKSLKVFVSKLLNHTFRGDTFSKQTLASFSKTSGSWPMPQKSGTVESVEIKVAWTVPQIRPRYPVVCNVSCVMSMYEFKSIDNISC